MQAISQIQAIVRYCAYTNGGIMCWSCAIEVMNSLLLSVIGGAKRDSGVKRRHAKLLGIYWNKDGYQVQHKLK